METPWVDQFEPFVVGLFKRFFGRSVGWKVVWAGVEYVVAYFDGSPMAGDGGAAGLLFAA